MSNQLSRYVFAAVLLLCALFAHAQTPVSMAPPIHFQFLNASGQPLANGKLYTYAAGTTSCQSTYADGLGVTANPCPIPLDATGAPSNGSTEVGVFLSNASYRFVAFDANNVFQWSVDNVNTFFALLNSANTWTATQTFSTQIVSTLTDNQMVFGTALNQTILDFPPPSSNITLHMPSSGSQNVLGSSSPAITTPVINNVEVVNSPGTYVTLANATPTGTVLNALAIFGGTSAMNATVATTSTTSGVIGVCVLNCGSTGTATIQQSGQVSCIFDGATTFNDAVIPSTTTAGDCHDAGSPSSALSIGTVQSTNSGAGTYSLVFTLPAGGPHSVCALGAQVQSDLNTTSNQVIQNCGFLPGVLNAVNKAFRVTASVQIQPSSSTSAFSWGFGAASSLGSFIQNASETTGSTNWSGGFQLLCMVTTAGSSGNLQCGPIYTLLSGSATSSFVGASYFNVTLNLTGPIYVGTACSFGTASTSNLCTTANFLIEQLN